MNAFKSLATFWYTLGWIAVAILFIVVIYKTLKYFGWFKNKDDE